MAFDKNIDYEKCVMELKDWWKNDPLMPSNIGKFIFFNLKYVPIY